MARKSKKANLIDRGNCLAEGEQTGHAHRVAVAVTERVEDGVRMFDGATTVVHEEHKPIVLPARQWNSAQKTEHDYIADMERRVTD
jgi:hypothetical protein